MRTKAPVRSLAACVSVAVDGCSLVARDEDDSTGGVAPAASAGAGGGGNASSADAAPPAAEAQGSDAGVEARVTELTADALLCEDAERKRVGAWMVLLGLLVTAALLQLVEVKTTVHWMVTALLLTVALSGTLMAVVDRGNKIAGLSIGVLVSIAALAGIAYLGVLSAVTFVLCPLVFAYASSDWRIEAWGVFLTCVVGYLLLGVLSYTGLLELTRSLLALQKENLRALVGITVLIEMLLAFSFWFGSSSRRATRAAIAQIAEARSLAEWRGALLVEANGDLQRAARAASLGRFSGLRIDRYVVGEVIGRGAMGEVYAAEIAGIGQSVALKFLHQHLIDCPRDVERFARELVFTAQVDSPHVVSVLGGGATTDGTPYLAMERLCGEDLAAILRERNRLGVGETVELVTQLASGLEAARNAGIVHRDIKPQNVFRVDGSVVCWKLLDFGVSRFVERASSLTMGPIGTPAHMSPEQCRGEPTDHRADVFSLAAIAYRCLTGRPPFARTDQFAVLNAIVNEQPLRPSDLWPMPADVDLALVLGLAKQRDRRFDSAASFADALRRAAHNAQPNALREQASAQLQAEPWSRSWPADVCPAFNYLAPPQATAGNGARMHESGANRPGVRAE